MYNDYKEMYAEYCLAKKSEQASDDKLEQELEYYQNLITKKIDEREHSAGKRLVLAWLSFTVLPIILFINTKFFSLSLPHILLILFIMATSSAFLVFIFLPWLDNLIYQKNVDEAQHIEELKFRWLVIKSELDKRSSLKN